VASDDSTSDDSDDSVAELLPEDPPQAEADLLPDDPAEDLAPDPPTVPDTSTNEVDADLKKRFWSLVLVFNVALFGMSLGAMLVGFRGRWEVGGAIFAVGAFAFLRGWWGYRRVSAETEDSEETDDSESEGNGDDSDDASADTTDRSANDSVQKD
jgi:hypothetical protein